MSILVGHGLAGTSGAAEVQPSDNMTQVFLKHCSIALRVRAGGGVYGNLDLSFFVPHAILAAHNSSRWVSFSVGTPNVSLLHMYVLFRIKGTIFSLKYIAPLGKIFICFFLIFVSHCILSVLASSVSTILC